MNKLPKNWYVKQDKEKIQPVITYLNENFTDEYYNGNALDYFAYGVVDNCSCCHKVSFFINKAATLLSIEEFIYLSKEIEKLPEEYIVECETKEETNEVMHFIKKEIWTYTYWRYVINHNKRNKARVYNGLPAEFSSLEVFKFSTWKQLIKQQNNKEMKKEFPEKWCIAADGDTASKYFDEQSKAQCYVGYSYGYLHRFNANNQDITKKGNSNHSFHSSNIRGGYSQITLEQFKEHVLLKLTPMETKEINYYEVLKIVWGVEGTKWSIGAKLYSTNRDSLPYFEKLGILKDTTIFKPVYKEEEFKVGDIATDDNGRHFYKITRITENLIYADMSSSDKDKWRKATPEEVKTYENNLLLEEAKKRYPIGTKFISAKDTDFKNLTIKDNWNISPGSIRNDGWSIYHNGKWAEIIPSHPQITINSYTGEFFDKYVKFGCAQIDKDLFIGIYNIKTTYNNRALASVTIGKGTFSKEQIKEIAEYYLNKK